MPAAGGFIASECESKRAIRTGMSCTLHDYGRVRRTHASGHPDLRTHRDGIAAADTGLQVRLHRRYGNRCSEHRHQPPDLRPATADFGSRSPGTPFGVVRKDVT